MLTQIGSRNWLLHENGLRATPTSKGVELRGCRLPGYVRLTLGMRPGVPVPSYATSVWAKEGDENKETPRMRRLSCVQSLAVRYYNIV